MSAPFYGKYRGTVTDNQDPNTSARIRAKVPDVLGDQDSGWALPCVPFAGSSMGVLGLPPVGADVWIEFEHGDPDYPVWTGCFWGSGAQLPSAAQTQPEQKIVLVTSGGHSIVADDSAQTVTLKTSGGQKIELTSQGITIDNGSGAKIELSGPKVSINGSALEVT